MKHFVFSDIHGNGELFQQIMDFLNSHDEWQCFVIGDVCDRGLDGYRMMKQILADDRFVYLAGNHEQMFVNTAMELARQKDEECWTEAQMIQTGREWLEFYYSYPANHYFGNGGDPTFEAWLNDGAPMSFVYKIKNLPVIGKYEKYDMIHAGCLRSNFLTNNWDAFDKYDAVWNRSHFINPWVEGRTLIHGHTPVCNMPNGIRKVEKHNTWTPMIYNDGEKINMDCATYHSDRISVMDLDTGEFHHFAGKQALPIDF